MAKTRLTLVRHGETEWNVAARLQGVQNSNLTHRGVLQAKQVAAALHKTSFTRIVTSDLQRAIDTAHFINEGRDLPMDKFESIRERRFGIMEGLYRKEIEERYPETYRAYISRNAEYQIPDGESLQQFYQRVTDGINQITDTYPGENLLVVTHGGVLDCIIRMVFNYPLSAPRCFALYNASINILSRTNKQWKIESWGDVKHQTPETASIEEVGK